MNTDAKGITFWLTGLPSAGKTTIADIVAPRIGAFRLDGDVLRDTPIAEELGFSKEDRTRNVLRAATVCKLMNEAGVDVVASFISPTVNMKVAVRNLIGLDSCRLFHVSCTPEECAKRDPKGLWHMAKVGEITGFTGYDAPYEVLEVPESQLLDTCEMSAFECSEKVVRMFYRMKPAARPHSVFIGRWSPFHNGHRAMIETALDKGENVLVLVRNVLVSDSDPWTAWERKAMVELALSDYEGRVTVMVVPDVGSVVYGRKVGYSVNEVEVTEEMAATSGTEVRRSLLAGEDGWKQNVPACLREYLEIWRGQYRKD